MGGLLGDAQHQSRHLLGLPASARNGDSEPIARSVLHPRERGADYAAGDGRRPDAAGRLAVAIAAVRDAGSGLSAWLPGGL